MEKTIFSKNLIQLLDLHMVSGFSQLDRGLKRVFSGRRNLVQSIHTSNSARRDNKTAAHPGMAGLVVPGEINAPALSYPNPKWGGLYGCLCNEAHTGGEAAAEGAELAALYRLRFGLPLGISAYAIQ